MRIILGHRVREPSGKAGAVVQGHVSTSVAFGLRALEASRMAGRNPGWSQVSGWDERAGAGVRNYNE